MSTLTGIGAAPGVAVGPAILIRELPKPERKTVPPSAMAAEKERLAAALRRVRTELTDLQSRISPELQGVIRAQLLIMDDPELIDAIESGLSDGKNAEWAVEEAADGFVRAISALNNEYLRERANDVRDFARRLLAALMHLPLPAIRPPTAGIVIAKDLTPSDTAGMDVTKVLGFATELGGPTSHSAIMARAAGLPAIVGVSGLTEAVNDGDIVVLNAETGEVIVNPSAAERAAYEAKAEQNRIWFGKRQQDARLPAESVDGRRVELAANIGGPHDVSAALQWGAEGVGLFRTEFLYMRQSGLPDEEEQFVAYKTVAEQFKPHPVVIRTLDIGGDKELPYLPMPAEQNPFLGYRAIRLCLDRQDLFKTQLRAILRASAFGNVKIMFPMVSTLDELRRAKRALRESADELGMAELPETGIMVEVPATALLADAFAAEVDFFSIGSNDLIQYTMAADRGNQAVRHLYRHLEPAVLRLIARVIEAAHRAGIPVGMCGEMAGDPQSIPLLFGFGLEKFSMSAAALPQARELIRSLSYEDCRKLADRALACREYAEVAELVSNGCASG